MADYILSFDPGTINLSFCLIHIHTLKIHRWGLFSIKSNTTEGSCKKLAEQLDSLHLIDGLNVIIVHELQPRCNSRTIAICGMLQMYYVLEKMNEENTGTIDKIVGYHAKHKIKYYEPRPDDEPLPKRLDKLKKGHYRNKQVLIEHTRRVLKHNKEDEWLEWFEKQPKQDDESDCYIMSCSYLKTNKLGPFKDQ